MPRYRKLHVKATDSLDINDMPDDFTRLMWLLLPLKLCREGRGIDDPMWLRSKLFPLRHDVTLEMVDGAMCWYQQRGMIQRYEAHGRRYFCIPAATWHYYQGNTDREMESDFPPPPDESATNSRPTHDQLTTNSCLDADANADANTNTDADAPSAPSPVHTPAERVFLETIGAFEDEQDRQDILNMETQVGSENVIQAIKWARRKRIDGNDLIQSICTAASKWIQPTGPPGNGRPGRRRQRKTVEAIESVEWSDD